MLYKSHKEIPPNYKRLIMEECLVKRAAKVPLQTCNEIIQRMLEEEEENETLKNFEVEFIKNGRHQKVEVVGRQSALVEVDRVLEYGTSNDDSIIIAVRQAKRLVAAYAKQKWLDIPSKDSLRIIKRAA